MIGIVSLLGLLLASCALLALRIYLILPSKSAHRPPQKTGSRCSLAVFLGSGGHTSEMRALLSSLPYERYAPRTYIYCHGDEMSLKAVAALEAASGTLTSGDTAYTLLPLPRARKVAQPLPSTILSVLRTIVISTWHLFLLPFFRHPVRPFADVLLVNGPGTCVVLVLICWIRRDLNITIFADWDVSRYWAYGTRASSTSRALRVSDRYRSAQNSFDHLWIVLSFSGLMQEAVKRNTKGG